MSSTLLSVDSLHTGYDGVAVVRDLTMHVEAGEVVALLGPNGAGKTTTLMTISGMGEILAGSVDVMGSPVPGFGSAPCCSPWCQPRSREPRNLVPAHGSRKSAARKDHWQG